MVIVLGPCQGGFYQFNKCLSVSNDDSVCIHE